MTWVVVGFPRSQPSSTLVQAPPPGRYVPYGHSIARGPPVCYRVVASQSNVGQSSDPSRAGQARSEPSEWRIAAPIIFSSRQRLSCLHDAYCPRRINIFLEPSDVGVGIRNVRGDDFRIASVVFRVELVQVIGQPSLFHRRLHRHLTFPIDNKYSLRIDQLPESFTDPAFREIKTYGPWFGLASEHSACTRRVRVG